MHEQAQILCDLIYDLRELDLDPSEEILSVLHRALNLYERAGGGHCPVSARLSDLVKSINKPLTWDSLHELELCLAVNSLNRTHRVCKC